jgi:DNA-binding IclR family transcriptional regulator
VRSLSVLKKQLAEIRRRGYSISDQENEEGIKAVSVPIRTDPKEAPVGFVSITAPVSRNGDDDFDRFRHLLQAAAANLGDIWPPREANDLSPPVIGRFQILD